VSCSVHDVVDLEARGIPSVFVASEVFADGAARQATALGFDPAAVYVPHPIQDRTDEEVTAIADRAVEALIAAIVARA
jgi:dsRNA-specific ribonuclease